MFFSEKYLLDTLNLTNSIIFHLHAEAVNVNIELQHKYSNYIFEETDITTWKHYVNMSGEYHSLDLELLPNLIQVKVIETNTYMPLTKALLETYKNTHEQLKLLSTEYETLVNNYPEYETLIKGIVYPIDMEILKNAEDGDILKYNISLVEKQEYSLISSIEKEIKLYLSKWHVAEYTLVDEYYIPALIAGVTTTIIKKIINHRFSKIGTEEVHSYLMSEFFKSNLSIHNDVDVLTDDVKLWLYKNLKYLIKHTGKDNTLDIIIKNILNKSGLYVKEAVVLNRLPVIDNDATINMPTYSKKTNNIFYVMNGELNTVVSDITNELMLYDELNYITYGTKDLILHNEKYKNILIEKMSNPTYTIERSKVISIEYANLYNIFPTHIPEVTLENWIYNVLNIDIINYRKYTDPNTKITYYMSEKDAVLLVIKHLLVLINMENVPLTDMILSNVPSEITNSNNLLVDKDDVLETVENLLSKIIIYNGDNINDHIESIIHFYNMLWVYANDENNPAINSDISLLYERIKKPIKVTLSDIPKSILDITENIPFNYGEEKYDYKTSIVDMIKVFTGINIDKHGEIDSLLKKFKNMIDKLTSYTVQVIPENVYASINIANNPLGIIRDVNVITPIKESFICLELIDLTIDLEANDFKDNIYVNNDNIVSVDTEYLEHPKIDLSLINDTIFELKIQTESFVNEVIDDNARLGFVYSLPAQLG